MKTISTKVELIEWLKSEALYSDIWSEDDIPDVKPVRKSKWKDSEFEPYWLSDSVAIKVPRGSMKDEIGGYVKVMIDLVEQNETVRVKFVRTRLGRHYYTVISKFGHIDFLKSEIYACESLAELLKLINTKFNYKISLERE